MTEAAPQNQPSNPMLFSISGDKDGTAFKIKQFATGVHFMSLLAMLPLYMAKPDKVVISLIVSGVSFLLANFIPPTGMIKPHDMPEFVQPPQRAMPETETKAAESKKKNKKGKKKD
eukprot:CAMPEP_0181098004 /NCGR_PEP_ID=MMETSP1071-20121207/11880_1 /TAXON_ID=35127 /ORGANISM="Thalassiosira sp., Strain NH16" /LENGTH=115 /DNA_ID=CAMNT_0023180541 /DNA_START=99 /DNA_END=446 /DNA_ORIENTATION=-